MRRGNGTHELRLERERAAEGDRPPSRLNLGSAHGRASWNQAWLKARRRGTTYRRWKLVIPIVMVTSAVIAEVIRAGVRALDRGQTEAAQALGLRYGQALRLVVLPQALRLVLPRLISLLRESTLGYAVSYPELMKQGDFLTARTQLLF